MATSVPSLSLARCTCPSEAAARALASKLSNTSSIGLPSSSSKRLLALSGPKAGTASCKRLSSSMYSGASKSDLHDAIWPSFTYVGPNLSNSWTIAFPAWLCNLDFLSLFRASWARATCTPARMRPAVKAACRRNGLFAYMDHFSCMASPSVMSAFGLPRYTDKRPDKVNMPKTLEIDQLRQKPCRAASTGPARPGAARAWILCEPSLLRFATGLAVANSLASDTVA
mmetsp:Transcript_8616/g.15464  ORF Transcript_8616/g.15464 Transcript_8616/m.15464 type:complete len:227 (+) Transcript_8616:1057-1737(+)